MTKPFFNIEDKYCLRDGKILAQEPGVLLTELAEAALAEIGEIMDEQIVKVRDDGGLKRDDASEFESELWVLRMVKAEMARPMPDLTQDQLGQVKTMLVTMMRRINQLYVRLHDEGHARELATKIATELGQDLTDLNTAKNRLQADNYDLAKRLYKMDLKTNELELALAELRTKNRLLQDLADRRGEDAEVLRGQITKMLAMAHELAGRRTNGEFLNQIEAYPIPAVDAGELVNQIDGYYVDAVERVRQEDLVDQVRKAVPAKQLCNDALHAWRQLQKELSMSVMSSKSNQVLVDLDDPIDDYKPPTLMHSDVPLDFMLLKCPDCQIAGRWVKVVNFELPSPRRTHRGVQYTCECGGLLQVIHEMAPDQRPIVTAEDNGQAEVNEPPHPSGWDPTDLSWDEG